MTIVDYVLSKKFATLYDLRFTLYALRSTLHELVLKLAFPPLIAPVCVDDPRHMRGVPKPRAAHTPHRRPHVTRNTYFGALFPNLNF